MKQSVLFILFLLVAGTSCKKDEIRVIDESYQPDMSPARFANSTNMTNPYLPMEPGKKYIFEAISDEGTERVEVQRLNTTKNILGITCVIVNDKAWLNGVLIEDTDDWYAQDNEGNVWYLGEEVDNYNADGSFKDHGGSWEAGVDGAKAGIVMLANPQPGMSYRQEYYFNEAEDEGEVEAIGQTVVTAFGTFNNCIKTRDWTELDPVAVENKFYAPGKGLIKAIHLEDGEEEILIAIE
ncbi:MAG: hypothetical protein SH848_12290 [Saprospiraceae bacterium]|nr:hypothetical protein [Saprospiraceae bacterium]MDZ4704704.1 hypothetical protein [Saprospiraceae bacterium]